MVERAAPPRLRALLSGLGSWRAILVLGVTQIVSWGCVYYAIAVLAPAIQAELGWSTGLVLGGVSVAFLCSGLMAPAIGRLIERRGGVRVMAAGAVASSLALAALGLARDIPTYYAAWVLIGIAQATVLYEAAFSTLAQIYGAQARRAIVLLTFFGGFASTVFWPITLWLLEARGWRDTYIVLAALHLAICLPLYLFALPRPAPIVAKTAAAALPPARPEATRAFWLLAAALALSGYVLSAMGMHMILVLQNLGFSAAAAVLVGSLVGPAQVAGRMADFVFGGKAHPLSVGIVALGCLPLGLCLLVAGGAALPIAIAFALFHGVAQGLNTIVRGAVPLALFGAEGYAVTVGKLAAPNLMVRAAAPVSFAWLIDAFGTETALWIGAAIAAAGFLAMAVLRWSRPRAPIP